MTTRMRWLRFNLVGLTGATVQLGSLAALNRALPRHYLLTSTVALEVTLLHNFTWHTRYTWRDGRHTVGKLQQLIRFHASTGATSLLGNLVSMRVLVHRAHLPVVLANAISIAVCSGINFLASSCWIFPSDAAPGIKTATTTQTSSLWPPRSWRPSGKRSHSAVARLRR